ncbi:MAG: diacylglycerol kinase family protein [Candidatus Omnitrophica bacterium]|nr:diacylglycerol kinase family protein [Candidatus Omnitrophota bacterium]
MSKQQSPFSFALRAKSFTHAFAGLRDMFLTEHNAWIHALASVLALGFAWWLKVDPAGFSLVIMAVAMVWVAEAFNTVLEMMANLVVGQRYSKTVKRAKDIAASAVLIAAVGALGVGVCILGPPFYRQMTPWLG